MNKRVAIFFLLLGLVFTPMLGQLAVFCAGHWDDWTVRESLDLRADQSAIVCAICAVPGLALLAYVAVKLREIEKRLRK